MDVLAGFPVNQNIRLPELLILLEHAEVGVVALGADKAGVNGCRDGAERLVGGTLLMRGPAHTVFEGSVEV